MGNINWTWLLIGAALGFFVIPILMTFVGGIGSRKAA
jgi:hypothetical protein